MCVRYSLKRSLDSRVHTQSGCWRWCCCFRFCYDTHMQRHSMARIRNAKCKRTAMWLRHSFMHTHTRREVTVCLCIFSVLHLHMHGLHAGDAIVLWARAAAEAAATSNCRTIMHIYYISLDYFRSLLDARYNWTREDLFSSIYFRNRGRETSPECLFRRKTLRIFSNKCASVTADGEGECEGRERERESCGCVNVQFCLYFVRQQQIRSFTNNLWCIFVIRYPCFVFVGFFRFIFWSACANSRAGAETFAILDNGLDAARLCVRLLIGLPVPPLIRNRTIPFASYLFFHHRFANV